MSYESVLNALEEGDYVTFNASGGAIGRIPPELSVATVGGDCVAGFVNEGTGEWWRVIERDGELVMQYDRDYRHADTEHDWHDYDTIETVELIATSRLLEVDEPGGHD